MRGFGVRRGFYKALNRRNIAVTIITLGGPVCNGKLTQTASVQQDPTTWPMIF